MENMLRVGVLTSAHGVHGEVNVYPTTDDPNRFKRLKKAYIDLGKEKMEVKIAGVKFFKNMVILKFEGHDDRNEIEKLKSHDLLIDRADAVELKEGEHFICDLIGFKVVSDEGEEIGKLRDILQTAANDVYQVDGIDGKEKLIPSIPDCILNIDMDAELITVHVLKGLFD